MAEKGIISAVHLQLTGRCNLKCAFCGQSRGMLASGYTEFPVDFWLDVAEQARRSAAAGGEPLMVTLWGGEPLLYNGFDELASTLHRRGFRLSMVTNGTMIERHAGILRECLDCIYISLDGPREINDSVRGKGVFDLVSRNVGLLDGRRGRLIFLTTVSDSNVRLLPDLPDLLADLRPDMMVMGQLMYLTGEEIEEYRRYSRENFGCDYPELTAWRRDDDAGYLRLLADAVSAMNGRSYPFPVRFTPHWYPGCAPDTEECNSPFRRVHVRQDGEVGFCTDYFGFSAGNVKDTPLQEIFDSPRAEQWRRAVRENRLPVCRHCPWRLQHIFRDCAD